MRPSPSIRNTASSFSKAHSATGTACMWGQHLEDGEATAQTDRVSGGAGGHSLKQSNERVLPGVRGQGQTAERGTDRTGLKTPGDRVSCGEISEALPEQLFSFSGRIWPNTLSSGSEGLTAQPQDPLWLSAAQETCPAGRVQIRTCRPWSRTLDQDTGSRDSAARSQEPL